MRNKLFTLILSLLLCLTLLPVPAMGEIADDGASIQQLLVSQGTLWFTFSAAEDMNESNMSLLMNGQPLNNAGVRRMKDSELKTSYVFLVDASQALNNQGFNQARALIVHLLKMLPANSNIGVMTVAEALDPQGPVSLTDSRDEVLEQVKKMKRREVKNDANPELSLYRALVNMDYLINDASNVNARRVLVVLSDGIEDAVDGLTTSELAEKLEDMDLVIHTIALMNGSNHDISSVQEMSSWARKKGGVALSMSKRSQGYNGTAFDNLYKDPTKFENYDTYKLAKELASAETELYAAGFTVQESRMGELNGECSVQLQFVESNGGTLKYPAKPLALTAAQRAALQTSAAPAAKATAAPTPEVTAEPAATEAAAQPVSTPVPATEVPAETAAPAEPATAEADEPAVQGDDGAAPAGDDGAAPANEEKVLGDESVAEVLNITGNETVNGVLGSMQGMLDKIAAVMVQEALFGLPMWVFVAAGALLLILILVIVLVLVKKNKKVDSAEDMIPSVLPNFEEIPNFAPDTDNMDNERTVPTSMDTPDPVPGGMPPVSIPPAAPAYRLILTEINVPNPKQYLHVTSDAITVLGRKVGVSNWVMADNESLSGRHCQIERTGDRFIITDLHSTNGTFVNGQKIEMPVEIGQEAKITLGRRTYNFNWMNV